MIVIVLGMHKSGTTLISSLLHHADINMVETTQGNYEDDGFYERESTYQMNLKLLGIPPDAIELHAAPEIIQMTAEYEQEIQEIIAQNTHKYSDWGFKDPRTCLVYRAWEKHLPEHKLVIIYRPVEDIWSRFIYKGFKFWKNLHHAFLVVLRWCEYNQHIVDILKKSKMDYIVLNYAELMQVDNREFYRLQDFLGNNLVDMRQTRIESPTSSNLLVEMAKYFVEHRTAYCYNQILHELDTYRLTGKR